MPGYLLYDISHATLGPWRAIAEATKLCFDSPFNPLARTMPGRSVTAACELFERATRRYQKPAGHLQKPCPEAALSQSGSRRRIAEL